MKNRQKLLTDEQWKLIEPLLAEALLKARIAGITVQEKGLTPSLCCREIEGSLAFCEYAL